MLEIGFHSLSLAFLPIVFKLIIIFVLGRSVYGLQMGKLRQRSSELWPFIDVRNWFSLSIFDHSFSIVFKLGIIVDIGRGVSWDCIWANFDKLVLSYGP